MGYLAEGVVYGLLGILTAFATFTAARYPGLRDALASVNAAPFGRVLLALVAAGLLCRAAWRFVQAVRDTEGRGRSAKGVAARVAFAIGGVAHLLLASAAGIAAARGTSAVPRDVNDERAAWLLSWPGGWLVLVAAGLAVAGVGLNRLRLAYRADFMCDYERASLSDAARRWVRPIGRWGLAARGVAFCLVGLFLVLAGWRSNPDTVRDIGEALAVFEFGGWGRLALALIAAGLFAYGVFCLSLARYRRLDV